jgi:transposase
LSAGRVIAATFYGSAPGQASGTALLEKRKGALCDWLAALRARKPAKVVGGALANKLARIVWAIITTGEAFRSSIYAKA